MVNNRLVAVFNVKGEHRALLDLYAVDSSFYDNGAEPVILPLKEWLAGWEPPNFHF